MTCRFVTGGRLRPLWVNTGPVVCLSSQNRPRQLVAPLSAEAKVHRRLLPFSAGALLVTWPEVPASLPAADKNFEDDDSVDGGRSSSSSKATSLSGRKVVSMGSFRRPASANKSAGQTRDVLPPPPPHHTVMISVASWRFSFCSTLQRLLGLWMRRTSSRLLKMFLQYR